MTLAEFFEKAADGPILAAVLANQHDIHVYPKPTPRYAGKVLPWFEARRILDYEAEYWGAAYAWTATQVIFVSEYDGNTFVTAVPCHPVEGVPVFP